MAETYVFYQNQGNGGNLMYSTAPDQDPKLLDSQIGITAGPSAVMFQNKLYCFRQRKGNGGKLWYNTSSDGENWQDNTEIGVANMSQGPSAVVFQDKLYCFTQGKNNNGQLWYVNSSNGNNWSSHLHVSNANMAGSPSAVVFQDKLYCFHQGRTAVTGANGQLWYLTSSDGNSWSQNIQVKAANMSESPSAVVFQDKLYCFHQGRTPTGGANGQLWYLVYDGDEWSEEMLVPGTGMSESPSAMVLGDELYCFYQGESKAGTLWCDYSADGKNWREEKWSGDKIMSASPSAVLVPFSDG